MLAKGYRAALWQMQCVYGPIQILDHYDRRAAVCMAQEVVDPLDSNNLESSPPKGQRSAGVHEAVAAAAFSDRDPLHTHELSR